MINILLPKLDITLWNCIFISQIVVLYFFVNTSFESIRKLHIRCSGNYILLVIAQYFT